jgi:hypothetical protein
LWRGGGGLGDGGGLGGGDGLGGGGGLVATIFIVDPQLEILIENGKQTIKTSRVIKIFDWDLSWDSDGLGAMRKDLIGEGSFSKLDEIYDKVGFLRSLLQHGYFVKGVHDDKEILAILEDTKYTTELCTSLAYMDDEKMLRLSHLELQLSKDDDELLGHVGKILKFQKKFQIKIIGAPHTKTAENNYTATLDNEFTFGEDLQITFQRDENGFSVRSVDGSNVEKVKNSRTLYYCVARAASSLLAPHWKGGVTFTFTNKVWFNHVYPQISDMSKIKTSSAEFYVLKINSAVDIVYKYALKEFR